MNPLTLVNGPADEHYVHHVEVALPVKESAKALKEREAEEALRREAEEADDYHI